MARAKAATPSIRYHISGNSVVTIEGRDFYLGKHQSPKALARYAALISLYQQNKLRLPDGFELSHLDGQVATLLGSTSDAIDLQDAPITVAQVCEAYLKHCEEYHVRDLEAVRKARMVIDDVSKLAGHLKVEDFGPVKLREIRDGWVKGGRSRGYINSLVNLVIRVFRWGVSQELVPVEVSIRLRSLDPLRKGRTTAKEGRTIKPVKLEHVRATYAHLSPVLKAMLRVHVATGMRPTELCTMRPADIDRSGPVWLYVPREHKCSNKDKDRVIPIMGDARDAITDYLNRPQDAFCFSPMEATAWHKAKKRSERKSKVQPSQMDRSKPVRKVAPRDRYDKDSYRRALQRAAKKAKVPQWTPYEIRHLVGTVVAEALKLENAKALLGHSDLSTTQRYSKVTTHQAIEAARHAPQLGK